MLGIKTISEAIALAQNANQDLIEIAPNVVPPVCKIGNLSKVLYEKEKKLKDSRKGRNTSQVKEIRMRPRIGQHDFETKLNRIIEFLKDRNKVRVSFIFYGREMAHRDKGFEMLKNIEEKIAGVGEIEQRGKMYGNRMISILVPAK